MSNLTSANEKNATGSARKNALFIIIGVFLIVAGCAGFSSAPKKGTILGDSVYSLETASSPKDLARGLGGRKNMGKSHGMLFIFVENKKQCMWMKDMQFSLDIIWLNKNKTIIALEKSIVPETFPASFCHGPAKYVIELNAGEIQKNNIKKGQVVNL